MTVQLARVPGPPGRAAHYLAPVAVLVLVAAVVGIVLTVPARFVTHQRGATISQPAVRRLPPYWIVRPGDTLSQISVSTGLSVDQLEAFNPEVDPSALVPGARLNLWQHPPVPRPPPPGPKFWTVRPGESFGSIAAKTGINITQLESMNPQLKPASLQPGNRVRLRP